MTEQATSKSHRMLFFNTLAFTIAFAAWMLNGVLVTFLVSNQVFDWSTVQMGWLIGIPVLTGALVRFPVGILTDKFGGKYVYGILLILAAIPMYLLSTANTFTEYALYSLGFGITGASFAVGIAFTSVWYPKKNQGTALGIFGAGNAGAAGTALLAPTILKHLTNNGTNLDGWRTLPIYYSIMLLVMGIVFLFVTENKLTASANKTLSKMMEPLKDLQVWKFGLWYFLVFGGFVAFSQWLVPYFVNVYYLPLVTAGLFTAIFSFPSGVIRAVGGWLSDIYGGRKIMIWVLSVSVVASGMLMIPKMDIYSPGLGVIAKIPGTVTAVTKDSVTVGKVIYRYHPKAAKAEDIVNSKKFYLFPKKTTWQEAVVKVGDKVKKKQLLVKGSTRISFQANVWIFAFLAFIIGSTWGIGKAAVYKYIPEHYPQDVGMVGGVVGVLGGLGGFFIPIILGYLLKFTGVWSSAWLFVLILSLVCMWWLLKDIANERKV